MPSTAESPEIKADADPDEYSFIRTEDVICLVCTSGESTKRGYLAAEGFGSHVCHLESEPRDQDPCELWKCKFVIEDAMSVHAMYSQGLKTRVKKQSSRKILMYGHAVLLRHCNTKKLLRCLSTTSSNEKMAYDIGFTQHAGCVDESCWFIVRPASSQRSAGEKVRAGDDVYLVGVANERFLSAQPSFFYSGDDDSATEYSVLASFHQCVWSLHIVCSGSAVEAAIGHVNGGDVMRFVHRYRGSDVLTVSSKEYDKDVTHPLPKNIAFDVRYEKMSESIGLRSLWRVELFQMRFGGGFVGWGQPFRLRHMATGKFLGISGSMASGGCGFEDEQEEGLLSMETKSIRKRKKHQYLTLISADKARKETTAFCFSTSNITSISSQNQFSIVDCMGKPLISFGDSEVYLVHCGTHKKIVGCPVSERRHRVLSAQRKAIMQEDLHRSFAFTAIRASEQEAKAASNIQLSQEVMRLYVHRTILNQERGETVAKVTVEQLEGELNDVLDDLCYYFRSPDPTGHTHDSLNQLLCRLKERQNLFRNQGMLQFTLTVIMKTTKIKTASVQNINHKLYKLLAAMIRGNHGNCRAFATEQWLGEFMKQLSLPHYTHSVLDVIQCLLDDSPEVLNLFSPRDIAAIVNILNTSGRDEKVMRLLSSLCVCHGVAMRDKQRLIYKHLSSCQDLLLQTSLQNHVNCVHPSVYVGACDGSATYHKWYFEVQVTQLPTNPSGREGEGIHFRIGWAHVTLFLPTPTSNSSTTTAGGVGDDVYSVGFDGARYWVGGRAIDTTLTFTRSRMLPRQEEHILFSPSHSPSPSPSPPLEEEQLPISVGDVIGCCLDLERGVASFLKNGVLVEGHIEFHHCCKNITPALSFSAGISMVMSLGGHLGKFVYGPPEGYAGLYEAVSSDKDVVLQPFRCLGDPAELLVYGPTFTSDNEAFVPAPIDTSSVSLPDPVKRSGLQDRLAKNIHELWSKNKIEAGYCYGEVRNDDLKHNPCLKPFEELSEEERFYDYNMATQTLATLVVLGYQISTSDSKSLSHIAYQELPPEKYQMSNGYTPQPLNLDGVEVSDSLNQLVEKLAENAHNVWAVGRIQQGWTYGKANDTETKRNKLLVAYSKLDEATKKSNRDTAYESIRTICALGCVITPPPSSIGDEGTTIQQLAREFSHAHVRTRTFRGQTCYKITEGKWYYEVELLTAGMMRIGWAMPTFPAGRPLGSDDKSYAYDGYLARKWHCTSESFGHRWSIGDIVGCLLDIEEKTITYALNGEILQGSLDSAVAFSDIDVSSGLVPAITLFAGERAKMNFGNSEEPLRCSFALMSGFQSICNPAASLHYNIPLWYSAPGDYDVIDSTHHPQFSEERIIGDGQSEISKIRISYIQLERAKQECLKLNFGVAISSDGVSLADEIFHSPRRHTLPDLSKEKVISYKRPRGRSITEDDITPNLVSYSAVVPAGQDPETVFIGWTTAGFRYIESQFRNRDMREQQESDPQESRSSHYGQQVKVKLRRSPGGSPSVSSYSTAFMVCLSDLLPSPVPLRLALPVRVTCVLDTVYGEMTFNSVYTSDVQGDHCANKRAVLVASPGTKLFPTAIITPMFEHVIEFDFAPIDPYQPLSSVVFKPLMDDSAYLDDPTAPLCPRRIKVLALTESCWRRQPMYQANYKTSVGSRGAVQVTTEKDPSLSIFVTLPQEDRVMDILEISEHHKLMNFHIRTLEAYAAVCSHSNLELAKMISQHINCKQLLQCLKTAGMRSELKAAYLKLVTYLHLEHEVQTRLLMRGEFILPLSKCTHSVSLFPVVAKSNGAKPTKQEFSLKSAMLPGVCLGQSAIQHNITSSFSNMPFSSTHPDTEALVTELKELVFQELETLLSTRYYTMKLLPIKSRSQIFVPMIEMLDHLLVMGVIQSETDIQRLLCLLNPERLAPSNAARRWRLGLLSAEVTSEEDMKLALCNLLQHLCDCQVQHRVESIVMFANGYVEELRQEQQYRHDNYFMKNPKEFRCSPEQQLQTLLSFKHGGTRQRRLGQKLEKFHHELLDHCGAVKEGKSDEEIVSVWRKLQTMMELLISTEEQCCHDNTSDHVTSLQKLITETMMEWAGQEIHSLKLIGQIFALLYRQFDEIHEVKQALSKTYIIDIKECDGRPNYDIGEFREALGSLRLLMKVGMGKTEENLLRDSLRTIQRSELFYCHPHLLRQLGVHTILLDLMRTYLGISSKSSIEEALLTSRRKRRLNAHLDSSAPPPVADCCQFLCNFARISQANQRALFCYLTMFLDHVDEYPDVMSYSGYTPLDVATATIKGNHELILALEESHLEHVVQLLVIMTTNPHGSSEDSSMDGRSEMGGLGLVHRVSFSFNFEWSPQAGQKCLEFLHAAVWVDNEQVQENAHMIVRLLIQHSECLGPALAGDAHGLHKVYTIAIEQLPFSEAELLNNSQSREPLNRFLSRESIVSVSSQSSILSCSPSLTTQDVLSFYTDLLLLLAYCAAGTTCDHAHSGQSSTYSMQNCVNKQKQSAIARTRNILQNLIKTDDLIGILSLKFARGRERGVSPSNKDAAVLFLERAYGITGPEVLLKLLTDAFLPDLKLALKLVQCPDESTLSGSLNRYLCCSVLPLLSHHASIFPKVCSSHLHVVDSLLSHCFRLCCNAQLSAAQRDNLTTFFINVIRELHPQTVQKFMPRIISDIPHYHDYSVVSYKLLSSHYEHFSHYYQSDMLDCTSLGLPSNDEKTYSALVVYRLVDTLAKNLPSCGNLLRASVSCLKSVSCALVPDCSIPNEAHLSTMYSTSITSFEPRPLDTSRIVINHKLKGLVTAFASYKHDCWVLDRQNEGWSHGWSFDEEGRKDPNIKPFEKLSPEEQTAAKAPVVEAVKYALMKGWSLSQVKCPEFQNLPLKPKLVCMMRPRGKKKVKERKKAKKEDKKKEREEKVAEMEDGTIYYEPESVYDLSKVGMRVDLLSLAERMADNTHNSWALQLKKNNVSYATHSQFVPYELLDEARREELRTFTLDLLRYVKVSGYDITRNRLYGGMSFAVSLDSSFSSEADPSSEEERKFSLQFFDRFLGYLTLQILDPNFYLKVLFPVMTSYLKQHRTYFMPSEGQRGHSFASREEKVSITVLFCQVMEFTRKNLDHLFPSLKKPSANVLSPGEGGVIGGRKEGVGGGGTVRPPAETDQSWAAAKCILSLIKAIIAAMDVKDIVSSEEEVMPSECSEMANFFRQATSGITLASKSINKLDKCDAQFTFYCLQLLVPSLTALFRHVGLHKVGERLIHGSIKGQCRYIFQNLVDMAMGTGPVYVGSSPLVLIGQCMGAFALAYPDPFLDTNLFGFSLQSLLDQLDLATREGVTCGNVLFVADIIIPVLASYIIRWNEVEGAKVPETCAEEVLTQVLSLIEVHFCQKMVPWVVRVIESSVLLAGKCSLSVLTSHLVPLMEELRERAIVLWQDEHYLLASWNKQPSYSAAASGEASSHQTEQEKLAEDYRIFVRDLLSVLPYLTLFLHSNHSTLSKTLPTVLHETSSSLFTSVADIFHCWGSSQFFRRQLQMTALQYKQSTQHMWSYPSLMVLQQRQPGGTGGGASGSRGSEKKPVNLLLVVLEFLLPVCDQGLSLKDRELVDWCKSKLGNKGVVPEDLKTEIMRELRTREGGGEKRKPLARKLVKKFSMHIIPPEKTTEERALHILSLARVKFRIQQVDKGHEIKLKWKQLLSQRKRKAIIGCFLAVPFFNLSKHRCMNMFLQLYCRQWLVSSEHYTHDNLTEELLDKQDYLVSRRREEMKRMPEIEQRRLREALPPDPLMQLLHMFKRIATSRECIDRQLYISYMDVLSKSVVGHQEDDEMTAEDNSTKAYILYSEEKARLMVKQAQLADRGAPAMVLLVLTAADGKVCPVVHSTLKLGIALLKEGNLRIQTEMLEQLKGIDVDFLHSIAKMIASCSVLDWNVYERYSKSEPVIGQGSDVLCKVLPDHLFTKSLFRFLQLLCEGHNTEFQNYLRTQAGNTTTVNIVISTVDYLLRLQESISDFYWHYTDYHTIDIQGRENFLKAFKVAKQVFRTLTEYIQGPCVLNQEALSRSRLWDAVSGFLHVFAILQRKLYKDTSQVELLRELLSLQEEMFILLLSMLEGSAMSSAIGKLMVDMLIESASYIEDIMTFFNMFVKLNDFSTAKAFREFDLNKDGLISYREFEMAMKAQQRYTEDEIAYLMECADLNKDGLLDYLEFTERFYQPAANIGFHLCVLIVHLSDHLPDDLRLERFKSCSNAKQLMEHFAKNMGCIEILGKSKRIERVYFEVKESRLRQWDEPHIRESRRNFLHSVELGSQKRKLQGFVSFCEDTIFEINHTDSISGSEQVAMETRALQHRKRHNRMRERPAEPFVSRMKETVNDFQRRHTWIQRLLAWLLSLCMLHLLPFFKRAAASVKRSIPLLYKKTHQKIVGYFKKSPHTSTTELTSRKLTKRHQLKLNIPLPQIQINGTGEPTHTRAQTTATEHPPTLRHRGSLRGDSTFTLPLKTDSRESSEPRRNGEARRATIHLQRGISEERRGSLSHTPRAFKLRQLTLNYDRSKMKAPSQASEGTTPNAPMMDGLEQKAPGESQSSPDSYRPRIVSSSWSWSALLARHYSTLTNFKLLVTIIINILLLTYRVEILPIESPQSGPSPGGHQQPQLPPPSGEMSAAANTIVEAVALEDSYWAPLLLKLLALFHFVLSAVLIASYWHFRVPLIIFKREKQVARRLEKMRLWITLTPLESWSDKWDSLVIGSVSFPRLYWDKQVKERVCENLRVGEEKRTVTRLLGMEVRSKFEKRTKWDQFLDTFHSLVDFRYQVWSLGVIVTDMMFIYHVLSCLLSFVGLNLNIFYFSIHLLDLIMHFKRLRTVLYSVLHNRRQLAMTALLMFMVIYLYTVLAFNFFREFYRQSTPEGSQVYNCDSMFKCFVYHIDQGLRSGGGIADVLEPAAGDMLRLLFDITFFFLVIIMLLAIIQGLIIDAFGELRDKEESLTAEMQNKCFVCGLPKNEFDHVPHGFDNHTSKQHNMAHYMFFLLYLIKKKESEFSGQESYVWEMYLKHNWDFFPVGDCFHAQEERRGTVGVAGAGLAHTQRRLKSSSPQNSLSLNHRTS